MMHSILIIGQSNMAGRGKACEVEPIKNDHLFVLRNGRWRNMYTPVNPDRVTAGVNLVESFADLYQKEHNVDVGIIPCADGGSCLDQWCVGGLLFDHACYLSELASRTSTIAAVLWHQGESDCLEDAIAVYEKKLGVIFDAFRKKLDLYDVPFLVGGLGDFLKDFHEPQSVIFPKVNQALERFSQNNEMTGFVSAKGLKSNPDNLHFCSQSLREFGVRYYEEFLRLENKHKVFVEKAASDNAIRTTLENL